MSSAQLSRPHPPPPRSTSGSVTPSVPSSPLTSQTATNANTPSNDRATDKATDKANGSGSGKSGKSTSRKILSRLLPFRPMRTNLADFHIEPKWPHKIHSPGDVLEGRVILATEKPIRITHLTVALHGFVRVYKSTTAVHENVVPPIGQSGLQYHGNGYATIFQDEQVLCGEGKLERGQYRFAFTLLFPKGDLPSNIDFERGTIGYDIVATMTRPTTIGPTVQCNRRVQLSEKIDVGMIPPPKPFQIYIEPISRAKRRRKRPPLPAIDRTISIDANQTERLSLSEPAAADTTDLASIAPSTNSEDPRATRNSEQLENRSEASGDTTTTSTGTGTGTATSYRLGEPPGSIPGSVSGSGTPTHRGHVSIKASNIERKTIKTEVELLKGGYLAGDSVTAKVTVQHNRPLKSMHGIIVTLFRQTRIDIAPHPGAFDMSMSKEERAKLSDADILPL